MAKRKKKTPEEVVRELLRERFPTTVFKRVRAEPGLDHDGYKVVNIMVVQAEGQERFDRKQLYETVHCLRVKLDEAEIEGFPIPTFVNGRDAHLVNLDAA